MKRILCYALTGVMCLGLGSVAHAEGTATAGVCFYNYSDTYTAITSDNLEDAKYDITDTSF